MKESTQNRRLNYEFEKLEIAHYMVLLKLAISTINKYKSDINDENLVEIMSAYVEIKKYAPAGGIKYTRYTIDRIEQKIYPLLYHLVSMRKELKDENLLKVVSEEANETVDMLLIELSTLYNKLKVQQQNLK